MPRTLLLCFIHGFKVSGDNNYPGPIEVTDHSQGSDDTFHSFPQDLKEQVAASLPDHNVESVVYPKYETKGELGRCSEAFLAW